MRVTKFVHSCLLVETPKLNVLIDPGRYTWESHLLKPKKIAKPDYIIITHEHGDHYDEAMLRELSSYFRHVPIITNNDLSKKIAELKLPNEISTGSEDNLIVFETPHEPLPMDQPRPLNIGVHILNYLTHPGDGVHFSSTREILALPITGSWINLRQSLKAVTKHKPKIVLPIHDWHWHKAGREEQYARVKDWLAPHNIEFIELENGVPVEI